MSQFNAPVRRAGGDLDVYTALLGIALLVLIGGIALLAMRNIDHSGVGGKDGGVLTIVDSKSR
jgi:hypothetical protein